MQGQGGSYIREKDGSLRLTSRTLPAEKPEAAAATKGGAATTKKKES